MDASNSFDKSINESGKFRKLYDLFLEIEKVLSEKKLTLTQFF